MNAVQIALIEFASILENLYENQRKSHSNEMYATSKTENKIAKPSKKYAHQQNICK